jgi:palmitoyltransferase ZDHHC9/14/18
MEEKPLRAYQQWPGSNRFFCNGRIIIGYTLLSPDYYRAILTFCLINLPTVLFLASPAVYFIEQHVQPIFLLLDIIAHFIATLFLFLTSGIDPGYIPKQVPPFAKGPKKSISIEHLVSNNTEVRPPLELNSVYVPNRGHLSQLKYCKSCKI